MTGEDVRVVVTGATVRGAQPDWTADYGNKALFHRFVATELIKQLLGKGFNVVGTVRDLKSNRLEPLKKLGDALPGLLSLEEADLLTPGAFDSVVAGAKYVFHCASPFIIEDPDPAENIVKVALEGTQNVIKSVLKTRDTVKRMVLTSSVAAVHGEYGAPPKTGSLYTEEDWNMTSTIDNGQAYHYSKRLAEEWAYEKAKESQLDLVSICSNFVLGPVSSCHISSLSVQYMKSMLEGGKIEGTPIICDVRDVAKAHIAAAETPSASGRYIISLAHVVTPAFVSRTLQEEFPDFDIQDGEEAEVEDKMDNSKARKELLISSIAPEVTLRDMARTMLLLKMANPKTR